MPLTILGTNAFAAPADALVQPYTFLLFGVPPTVNPGAAAIIQGVAGIPCGNWSGAAWIGNFPGRPSSSMLPDNPSPYFNGLATSPSESLVQVFLDSAGNLQSQRVTYSARATFPGGSLAVCLYRVDGVGRIQDIDDYRDPASFPGAVYAKKFKSI